MKFLMILSLMSFSLYGKEIRYSNEDVYLPISKEGAHLFFDESIVEITGVSSFKITQVEHEKVANKDYRSIFVEWGRGKKEEKVSFLLANRKKIHIVFKYLKKPGIMKISSSYNLIRSPHLNNRLLEDRPIKIQAINLLKAMRKKEFVKGYSSNRAHIELKDGFKDILTHLKGVYAGRSLNGFFVKIQNVSKDSVLIGHDKIKVGRPDLGIVSFVEKKKLKPQESTQLYLVSKKIGRHRQIYIPYYPITGVK